jgi:hypothetical protein
MYGVGFIRNCANYGDVTGAGMAAGLVGLLAGGNKSKDRIPSFYVDGVVNNGNVTSSSAAVKDALAWYNAGDWTSNHTAAGIIGKIEGVIVDIRNAVNNGTVIGSGNNVGGIVGVINHTGGGGDAENYTDTDVRIYDSVNNGDIMGTHNGDDSGYLEQISVGGIVGNTAGDFGSTGVAGPNAYYPGQTENVIISGCQNNGDISGPEGANVGAIVGLTSNEDSGKVIIDDSKNFNTGTVDGGGGKWAEQAHNGTTYDPSTHEVIDGQLVEKKPPVGPGVDPDPDPDPDPGEDPDPGANPDLGDPDPGANPDPGPGTPDPGDPDPGPGTPDPGEQPDPGETPPPVDNGETPPPVDNSQTPPPAGSTPPPAQDAAPPAAQAPAAAQASADAPAVTVDNRPAASSPQPTQEAVPEEIEPDPVPQDSLLGSEVTLTPVPLGLGFQSVANTILTIAVGAVALGILVVAGFTFWRMYRRRVA